MSNPNQNVPPSSFNPKPILRFWLYLLAAGASIALTYCQAKNWAWPGDAEIAAFASVIALINVLAAANVDPSKSETS